MKDIKRQLKVLMTADTVGGVWTYCMELCRSLQKYNVQFHLVTMGEKLSDWQRDEVNSLTNVELYETNYALEWMQNPWIDIEDCSEWLLNLEEQIEPDIVHLNCFAYATLPFKAPVAVVGHSDVYSWYLNVKRDDPPAEWTRYYWMVKDSLAMADLVIAPSKTMLKVLKNIYKFRTDSKVIYNGRDHHGYYSLEKRPLIFSMGRIWDDAKNTRLLVEAAPSIMAPVRIAGDYQFEQNGFSVNHENVEYLGKVDTRQIAHQLSAASVYVLPAKYEPFGLSALEAAFSRCALVLGDTESLHEIWDDNALFVDTNDKEALAETVNYLLKNENVRQHFAEKAFTQAQKYSSDLLAYNYLQVYKQLKESDKEVLAHEKLII
jgi:glycogen synthase